MSTMHYEMCGNYVFRAYETGLLGDRHPWIAEAKRADQPFVAAHALAEPIAHDVWFEFGHTRDEAIRKLKAELLH